MRRYILFALLLCLQWTARGQATYDYRYWFDSDEKNLQTGTATGNSWHIDADVSELSCTYHSIHMQVKDTAGVWSAPVTKHFVKMPYGGMMNAFYWFNGKYGDRKKLASATGKLSIDVSEIPDAMNYFHFQATDENGNSTIPRTAFFLKTPQKKNMTYRYWVDNDNSTLRSGEFKDDVMMLDVADIDDGFHVINFQVESNGNASAVVNRMFIKIPQTENIGEMTCLCFIDGKVYKQEQVPSEGGLVDWTLDVSPLSQGLHRIQVQVVTPTGAASNVYDSFFFRTTMDGELKEMKFVYSVDGEDYKTTEGTFNNGLFHFDVDVASLSDGLHRLVYMLANENGTSTKMSSTFFIKTPVGGQGIMSYKYWINDFENEAEYIKLTERKNPFELISLLPVKTCPIRSSCFHFEVEDDGTAMMYAKNDFHLQLFDASSRVAETHKQYVDYNVGQEIDKFTLLESGKRVYKTKPDENEVIWFKVEAVEGDSLSIKTDQACSLQIFSPSEKEMFTASGSESVTYDGCHAEEDGTYYIALHDVTGTKGTTIALDFQHIDKYDVLRWDVSTVGNGGASTITYEGNGFKDLYAIDYVNANGDTIKCDFIDHISDATISTITDYNGASIGSYKAIFHFTEEDKVIDNAVKVEKSMELTLTSNVTYPNIYLRNSTVTYTLELSNNGNMTAYRVPLYIYIASPTENGITKIDIDGLNLPKLLDGLDRDSISAEWLEYEEIIGDGHYFFILRGYDEDIQDSVTVRSANFFVDISPQSTKKISVSLYANETVNVWFTSPESALVTTSEDIAVESAPRLFANRSSIRDQYCCIRERVECVGNIIGDVVGFANTIGSLTGIPHAKALSIADCAVGAINTVITVAGEVACGENNVEKTFYEKLKAVKDGISISGTLVGCFEKFLKGSQLLKIGDISSFVSTSTHAMTWADCAKAFSQKKPGCPPPPPGGGTSRPVNSFDPNDIYGYRSSSGSKAVMKGQKEVYYTIEFENDTAFATASAQDVYLTDTLDARYFDLKSFSPTSLKIGDKKVELNGEADFVTTVDMRPRINAIAQVECDYDSKTGIAKWHFSSLDPMTMEPVETPMDGFLPVNNSDGDGIGEVSFNINLKDDFEDGTEISNRASIVFDHNEAIITPIWTNIVDSIAPKGNIISSEMKNDTTLTLHLGGTDNRSGIWKYDIYVQPEVDCSWYKAGENVADTVFNFILREGIDYGFCVIATDSAGNVEQKVLERQWSASSFKLGDANGDRTIDAADVVLTISKYLGNDVEINAVAADVNCDRVIDAQDIVGIQQIFLQSEVKPRGIETKKRIRLWQRQ